MPKLACARSGPPISWRQHRAASQGCQMGEKAIIFVYFPRWNQDIWRPLEKHKHSLEQDRATLTAFRLRLARKRVPKFRNDDDNICPFLDPLSFYQRCCNFKSLKIGGATVSCNVNWKDETRKKFGLCKSEVLASSLFELFCAVICWKKEGSRDSLLLSVSRWVSIRDSGPGVTFAFVEELPQSFIVASNWVLSQS